MTLNIRVVPFFEEHYSSRKEAQMALCEKDKSEKGSQKGQIIFPLTTANMASRKIMYTILRSRQWKF